MIKLEIEGTPYDNFKSLSFSRSMENFTGQFSFVATAADRSEFPIKRRSEARVLVNDVPIITGYLDSMTPFVSAGENVVNIQGRDKTADLVDSTLAPDSVEIEAPISFEEVILTTVRSLGLSLKVVNNVPDLEKFTAEDIISAEAGQNAFGFLEGFARKRQVLLTTNGNGDIVITRSSEEFMNYEIINRKNGEGNNVKTSEISYDDSKRFNKYVVIAQANLTSLNNFGTADPDSVVDTTGAAVIDDEIREGRVLNIVAEKASSQEQNRLRAEWEANWRKSHSEHYNSTTDDFQQNNGQPFEINRLLRVIDEDADLSAEMLVESIGLSLDVSGGTTTSFGILPRDAYTRKLEEPFVQKTSNNLGDLQF